MKLLLVEDNKKLSDNLKKSLEKEGYTIKQAFNLEQAFDMFYEEDFSLVILDINLPDGSGFDFCKNLREEEFKTPILMLTARDDIKDKVTGLNIGADDYLTKPFSLEELFARVRSLLRRSSGVTKNIFKIGNLKIDLNKKQVKIKNKEVNLSAKEYQLLQYLALNKGRLVSKYKILENVWGYGVDIETNVVDVYIGYLRKKLGKNYIKTVKGMGYKLKD